MGRVHGPHEGNEGGCSFDLAVGADGSPQHIIRRHRDNDCSRLRKGDKIAADPLKGGKDRGVDLPPVEMAP
ncbi:MAG: hypothetical protein MZV70_12505 [Desulfobacterales bacterium]|nr:hypothetical protein [Desulfobacterales bacterium]